MPSRNVLGGRGKSWGQHGKFTWGPLQEIQMEMIYQRLYTEPREPVWLHVDPGVLTGKWQRQSCFIEKVGFRSFCKGWRKAAQLSWE